MPNARLLHRKPGAGVTDLAARYLELAARGLRTVIVSLPDLAGPDDLDRMHRSPTRVALKGAGARRAASPGSRRRQPAGPTQP
jgi:hypothetical protein